MDYSPVLQPLFNALGYLIPLIILAGVLKSPWFKGKVGEFLVNASARLFLDKQRYHLIKNVTLPTEDGTTQIDHIIVSEGAGRSAEKQQVFRRLGYLIFSLLSNRTLYKAYES